MTNRGGWLKCYRSMLDNEIWLAKPFSPGAAWWDLVMLANYHEDVVVRGTSSITVERGEVFRSQSWLADRWGWSRGKVDRFLRLIRQRSMASIRTSRGTETGWTLITITNFARFQGGDGSGEPRERASERTSERASDGTSVEHPWSNSKKGRRKNIKERTPSGGWDEFLASNTPEDRAVLEHTAGAIASTRKGGKVSASVLDVLAAKLARYPRPAVIASCRIYLDHGHADLGRGEPYLLGIVRREAQNPSLESPAVNGAAPTTMARLFDRFKREEGIAP